MSDRFVTYGKIIFDPEELTNKHKKQASWKKVAIIDIEGEITDYYSWFIHKRYGLKLNPPQRRAHVTFVNDRESEISDWEKVKEKWDGVTISVSYSVDPRSDGKHWWLPVPEDARGMLHSIRGELGLGRPKWGLHLTVGYASERNLNYSTYIHDGIVKGLIT